MAEEKTPQGGEALSAAAGLVGAEKLTELGKEGVAPAVAPAPGQQPAAGAAAVQTIPKRGGDPAPGVAGAQAPAAGAVAPAQGKVEPLVIETPLGKQVFGELTDKDGNVTLKSFADVQAFAKTHNLDLKDVNDLQEMIKERSTLQQSPAEITTLKTTIANYERSLKSLPTEVSIILDAAMKNQDYSGLIQSIAARGTLDFQKGFDSYIDHDLINHYNDQKFTKDEFKEMETTTFTALKNLAKTRYQTEQSVYKNTIIENQRSADLTQAAFNTSVDTSIAQLRRNNPNIGDAQIQRIRDVMTGGLQSTLFSPENTYLPEAAERIAMQEFGAETIAAQTSTIAELVQKHQNVGRSQANEQILQRSDNRPIPGTGAAGALDENVLSKAVQGATSFMKASG